MSTFCYDFLPSSPHAAKSVAHLHGVTVSCGEERTSGSSITRATWLWRPVTTNPSVPCCSPGWGISVHSWRALPFKIPSSSQAKEQQYLIKNSVSLSFFFRSLQIKRINGEAYKRTFEEIVRNIDKMENECIPSVTLSKQEVTSLS